MLFPRSLPVAIVSGYRCANAAVAVSFGWLFHREPMGPRALLAKAVILQVLPCGEEVFGEVTNCSIVFHRALWPNRVENYDFRSEKPTWSHGAMFA